MTGRIGEDKIQEIRERIDIVELVSSYLPLKRSGANHLGLCPFHSEKTPSFNVNAPRQIFHCFGCGVGGDAFSFLMRMEGLSFPEALRRLAERAGVEIEEEQLTPAEEQQRQDRDRLLRVSEVAAAFYHQQLLEDPRGAEGRRYLRHRGYEGETVRAFGLGYAPDSWQALADHLAGKGFEPKWARDMLGLVRAGRDGRSDYDLFRKRLLFPIQDSRGRVVAFGGRVLDDSLPKYINSPESPIYHKGRILYGLYQAKDAMRRSETGIVVEGYFDQLALYRAGFQNAVATCGTALTAEHARLLKRYCKKLLLFFDQDKAGRKATFRAMEVLLAEGVSAAVVELSADEDPDSYLASHAPEELQVYFDRARPVLQVYLEHCLALHGDSIEGKARAAEEVLSKLRLLPSELERDLYLKELAQRTGLDEALLKKKAISRPRVTTSPPKATFSTAVSPPQRPSSRPVVGQDGECKIQEWLLHLMKINNEVRIKVAEATPETLFNDDDRRAIAIALIKYSTAEGRVDEDRVLNSLSEDQKEILSGIIIKDDEALAEDPVRIFADYKKAMERERLKARNLVLQAQIQQAEKDGDSVALANLWRESLDVSKKIKQR
ncbi:DNA primase [Syntrophotalea acetylenivorans]|uniref:DNA primase n=1 Tax=Syntrophotalea acetylenivorans TaxID=1842532 RepID=A0A1L3GQ68_9BACT|nr:DNA primase [Syntrophotalea acetylenivorans]APG27818.1 DNA primase [Syntrophotalea acetylenivorans]